MNVFTPHSAKQEDAIFSKAKITAILTGIQWGKTTTGAVRQKIRLHTHIEPKDNFIIAAPTYKIMQQSTLPAFLPMMEGLGEYSKSDAVFHMYGGGTCYMRTGTEPDSVVGITNVRGIWADEGGKMSLYFWENLLARAAFRDCPVDVTSSPYTLNWVYKDIVRPKMRDPNSRPDVNLIQASSIENPFFPRQEWERNRLTMDPRRFKMMFGGAWERPAGLVYDCFDEQENIVDPFELPTGTKFVGGIDWGHTEAFVFKVRAITPSGQHYGVAEFYKSGLTITDIVAAVRQRCQVWGVGPVYCGPDRPENIEELCRHDVRAMGADNSKRLGIDRHYELLKTRRLKYFRGQNPHTLDELEGYHYPEPEELDPDDKAKEALPVEQNDHAMDADRYISIMTFQSHERKAPLVPGEETRETQHQRIERLKKKPRTSGTERWSA